MPSKTNIGSYKGVPIPPGTDQEVAAQMRSIDQRVQSIAPADTAVMSADVLASNQRTITPIGTSPFTASAALQGSLEAIGVPQLQKSAAGSKKTADDSFEQLIKGLTSTSGETELRAEAYDKEGVDDLSMDLVNVDDEIRKEQHALTRQLEVLEKNPQGLLVGALGDLLEDTRRESLRKQADLYIIREGLQGKYDSAKSVADRAVAMQFEREERRNEALRLTYDRYQGIFDKDEQRAFEEAQGERERILDDEKTIKRDVYQLAIDAMQNGAPSSVGQSIMQATTREDAMAAAGIYTRDQTTGGGGFTLSPGQKRYDAAGNLIAEAPEDEGPSFGVVQQFISDNPNASDEELKVGLLEANETYKLGLSVTDINALIAAREKKTTPPTATEVKQKIVDILSAAKDTYKRGEAKALAESQLKAALGINDDEELPAAYTSAIDDAIAEVYGRTLWQRVLPGGR